MSANQIINQHTINTQPKIHYALNTNSITITTDLVVEIALIYFANVSYLKYYSVID